MGNEIKVALLVFITIVFGTILIINTTDNTPCSKQKDVSNELINGKISKVYLDSTHHNYETIELIVDGQINKNYFLLFEKSGLYNYVLPGDSIFKNTGSLQVNVIRGTEKQIWTLDYNCIED